jgi:hypothetical protein
VLGNPPNGGFDHIGGATQTSENVGGVIWHKHKVAALPHPSQESVDHMDGFLGTVDPGTSVQKHNSGRVTVGIVANRLIYIYPVIPQQIGIIDDVPVHNRLNTQVVPGSFKQPFHRLRRRKKGSLNDR